MQLADVLEQYVVRSGYTPGQLAKLSGIPKPTIVNWLEGRVKKPRTLPDLLQLSAVLHLTQSEVNHLLQAAGHPTVAELRASSNQEAAVVALLLPWAEKPVTPTTPAVPFQVMADLPYFVGRQDALQKLRKALTAVSHTTLYSIQGMGGVGKTVLAAHLAYQLRPYFPDGILWAAISHSDTMSILSTFAGAYGVDVTHYADLNSRSRVVRELLANKHALIVLDDVQSSEQVKPLLPPTGSCAVLITTRRHDLSVTRGAQRFVLGPFGLDGAEAAELFSKVLGEERVAQEYGRFQELAQLVGQLPLAVDVVASRLAYEPGWETADFLQRVRHEHRRLTELAYEDQNIRLSFNTSYVSLTPQQQRFFALLSLFAGSDFSDQAAAVAADVPLEDAQDHLRRLYGLSLVQAGRVDKYGRFARYALHPLLRDYARQQLAEETEAQTRVVRYFVQFAAQHRRNYALLEIEQANILAALKTAESHHLLDELVQGARAFYHFLEARGLYTVAAEYLAKAHTAAIIINDTVALSAVKYHLGHLAQQRGELIEAETQYEESLELAREAGDAGHLSRLLRALGVLAARRGDYELADAYYKEGLELARQVGTGNAVSDFLRGMGVQAYMRGDFARAEAFYEEGLALMQETAESAKGSMWWGLGVIAQEQGDITLAHFYYQQALTLARETGYQERIIMLLRSLGGVATSQGNYDQAEQHYTEALQLARSIGHRWQIGRILSEWGELRLAQGQTEAAQAAFQEFFTLARILQSQELVAIALYGLARVTAVWGQPAQARAYAQESLDTFTAIGHYKVQEVAEWLKLVIA